MSILDMNACYTKLSAKCPSTLHTGLSQKCAAPNSHSKQPFSAIVTPPARTCICKSNTSPGHTSVVEQLRNTEASTSGREDERRPVHSKVRRRQWDKTATLNARKSYAVQIEEKQRPLGDELDLVKSSSSCLLSTIQLRLQSFRNFQLTS